MSLRVLARRISPSHHSFLGGSGTFTPTQNSSLTSYSPSLLTRQFAMSTDTASQSLEYTSDRAEEVRENIEGVQKDIETAFADVLAKAGESSKTPKPRLVAVSKLKPASDIKALYDAGYRHFGENYIQEMADKAQQLPDDIRWHFIGNLQSNKSKLAASVPNLFVLETLSSVKLATMLDKALAAQGRSDPLNVCIQLNTSHEDTKSGVDPISEEQAQQILSSDNTSVQSEFLDLAIHVLTSCPHLRLHGLMTIGSFTASHDPSKPNPDFLCLKKNRELLVRILKARKIENAPQTEDDLELSMGMSADFEQAVREGSSSVRVGTRIFGERPKKVKAGADGGVTK